MQRMLYMQLAVKRAMAKCIHVIYGIGLEVADARSQIRSSIQQARRIAVELFVGRALKNCLSKATHMT
jgi:hypothetical protein